MGTFYVALEMFGAACLAWAAYMVSPVLGIAFVGCLALLASWSAR